MKQLDWYGLYSESWQGEIVPDAFSHPAKYSRGLIARIYDHMLEQGYIKPGDTVGDPFGGVALGAIHAMLKGLHWRGVELEQNFVDLGEQNIAMWQSRYGELLRGTAVLVQGDSRQFFQHVAGIEGVVSSPVYADVINGSGEGPGARFDHVYHNGDNATKKTSAAAYGRTAGNLGNLEGVVSSAPFSGSMPTSNRPEQYKGFEHVGSVQHAQHEYGGSRYKLHNDYAYMSPQWIAERRRQSEQANIGRLPEEASTVQTFWQAATVIVAQAYQAMRPGAYAAWVCGDYVRDGKRVHFGRQWMELCTAVGFEPAEWAVAWKTEYKGNQLDIFGNDHEKRIDRVSFFRRLANERNPDNAILNEDVIFMRKPM